MDKLAMYSPLSAWTRGDRKISPFVSLTIGAHSTTDDGHMLLTPELMTESEIDYEVNGLLAELEQFRKAAKAELSSLRLKMLER